MEDTLDSSLLLDGGAATASAPSHGWQKVTYSKRQRKPQAQAEPERPRHANGLPDRSHVFDSVEQKARERRRAIEAAAAAAAEAEAGDAARSRPAPASSDEDDDEDGAARAPENGTQAPKKEKPKKVKKPKVTVAEAAAKIDDTDLASFLAEISVTYESQQDIQLMRFADFFARSFTSVSVSQFPWFKIFKESPLEKIVDVPLSHIPDSVYKTSVDWLALKSPEALSDFVLWCLDGILSDLASQLPAVKGLKKSVQPTAPKALAAIFVVLAMTLRRKPDILISLLPKLRDDQKYQGQEKLPVIVWVTAQASQGDLVVGMYVWSHYLFSVVCGKSNVNPQSRDLVLQLIERILSGPKARTILSNGAVRKGERIVPPAALDLLMRVTFPASTARVKATERFEVMYPTLKELALAGSAGSKTTKQASQQLLPFAIQAIQENNPELTKEASDLFIWCLTQNAECYKQWEKLYLEKIDETIVVLRKLSTEWRKYSGKISPDTLKVTLKHLRAKNEDALSRNTDPNKVTSIKEADKYCKTLLGKLTRKFGCVKGSVFILVLGIGVYAAISPSAELINWENFNWEKLQVLFSSLQSS
ncbi:transmembrane protein 214-like [Zingiber officinale]|uniref:Transmembrane protein 214-A n=1 Tax=Zingiber officinale TaxID=94328 RepID=A0A8J5H4Q7_ZINOF|nr:transmembrane protein 214-like [Zingiber officinale]KAG6516523.1 hypothetical protein ZIOFF_026988 [Zingiber officinale]